jgi:hypothetical protein
LFLSEEFSDMRVKHIVSLTLATALTAGALGSAAGWAGLQIKHQQSHKDAKQPPALATAQGPSRIEIQTAESKAAEIKTIDSKAKPQAEMKGNIAPATDTNNILGELRSFDVLDMEGHDFSSSRENVPAEILEYARTALQNDDRLRYGSPGQGLLRFSCVNNGCSRIRAEVTQGLNGPVVWQTEELFEPGFLVNIHFLPDSRFFAKRIVGKLAVDYQKALKPLPMKINIQEE